MPTRLERLSSPAGQVERDLAGKPAALAAFYENWTARLSAVMARPPRPLFYNPVLTDTADDAETATVTWTAFPKRLSQGDPDLDAFRQGDEGPDDPNHGPDNSRGWQDEYCEWSVERNAAGKLVKVTFTCENRDYWQELWRVSPETVVALYKKHISEEVERDDLQTADGRYLVENRWNNSTTRGAMHLVSRPNNLLAEIRLAADATLLRQQDDGTPITDRDALIRCASFGEEGRHSDPSIGEAVNSLARDERAGQITLEDPFGLYIDKASLDRVDFTLPQEAPAGAKAADYWTILRGNDDFVLRVEYSVPPEHGFTVGDIKIDGSEIRYGGQIANAMQIKLTATYGRIGGPLPAAFTCGAPEILGFLDQNLAFQTLVAPAGAAGQVRLLCTPRVDPGAQVRSLNDRVSVAIESEIPVRDPDFRVFVAFVEISPTAAPGPVFFEVTNSAGLSGPASDPGLEVSGPPIGVVAGAVGAVGAAEVADTPASPFLASADVRPSRVARPALVQEEAEKPGKGE